MIAGRAAARGTVAVTVLLATLTVLAPAGRAAATLLVDAAPGCADAAGTTRWCTIGAAAAAATPGDTVQVAAGTYREQVTVPRSGTEQAPVRFVGDAAAVVLGTTDLSGPGWSPTSGTAWTRTYAPPSSPRQVFVDGARVPFSYDSAAKVLSVDLGGDDPGTHAIEAGARAYGFLVSGRSDVVVQGFTLRRQNFAGARVANGTRVTLGGLVAQESGGNGVLVEASPGPVTVTGAQVSASASVGIRLLGSQNVLLAGCRSSGNERHGVALAGTRASTVRGCTSWDNRAPAGSSASAAGFDVNADAVGGSDGNQLLGNTAFENQDTGLQVYGGSDDNVLARNVSRNNGDHGFDALASLGTRMLSNTAYGNRRDGFSIEGGSTGTTLSGNVAVDNGVTTGSYELEVDATSTEGFRSDHDLLWRSVPGAPLRYGVTRMASIAALTAATGQESHGMALDPVFLDAAAGDLRPSQGSPVTDAADATAPGFVLADVTGSAPVDDPSVADRGLGTPTFADLGAYEVLASPVVTDRAPHASLVTSPTQGSVPPAFSFAADASGSSDVGLTGIAGYTFDFGEGPAVGPQPQPTAQHAYESPGDYRVTLTVTDTAGQSSVVARDVHVTYRPPATYAVDRGAVGCSDTGPTTVDAPACTVAAATARALAGDTVLVAPGIYPEQLTVTASGTPAAPLTFRATGPGVVLDGTRDVSDPAAWQDLGTGAWQRSYSPPSSPSQVFVDGSALTRVQHATATSSGSFAYDIAAKLLTVHVGGANPGVGHTVLAGAQTYGIKLWGVHDVAVVGFTSLRPNNTGVSLQGASAVRVEDVSVADAAAYGLLCDRCASGVVVRGGEFTRSASVGLRLVNTRGVTVTGVRTHHNGLHGIALQTASGNTVTRNTSWANARPGMRLANGIDVNFSSNDNTVTANTTYGNQDSGIQLYNDSTRNLVARNLTYDNGDHGIDVFRAPDNTLLSNTAVGNYKDGYSIEGASSGTTLRGNVGVDNGLTTGEWDLYVADDGTVPGTTVDGDLFWRSDGAAPIVWDGAIFSSTQALAAATGQEARGMTRDPRFTDLAGRDLRPAAGSPLVDAADSRASGFVAADHDGVTPRDDPRVLNTGLGAVSFADLGALEYHGPSPALSLTPTSPDPRAVSVDATGSVALGAPLSSFRIDFGDGTTATGPSATHAYASFSRAYLVTLTVTDGDGIVASIAATFVTGSDDPPAVRFTASPTSGPPTLRVNVDASASTDTDGTPIAMYRFDCGNGTVVTQTSPRATCTYPDEGTYQLSVRVTDTAGNSASDQVAIRVRKGKGRG